MSNFKPGEIVDISIKGVRVEAWSPTLFELTIQSGADADSTTTTFDLTCDQVSVTRVAPAGWPPRPGDLWRDRRDGGLWFATEPPAGGVILNGYDGGRHGPDYVNRERGPMTLVHREEATP